MVKALSNLTQWKMSLLTERVGWEDWGGEGERDGLDDI